MTARAPPATLVVVDGDEDDDFVSDSGSESPPRVAPPPPPPRPTGTAAKQPATASAKAQLPPPAKKAVPAPTPTKQVGAAPSPAAAPPAAAPAPSTSSPPPPLTETGPAVLDPNVVARSELLWRYIQEHSSQGAAEEGTTEASATPEALRAPPTSSSMLLSPAAGPLAPPAAAVETDVVLLDLVNTWQGEKPRSNDDEDEDNDIPMRCLRHWDLRTALSHSLIFSSSATAAIRRATGTSARHEEEHSGVHALLKLVGIKRVGSQGGGGVETGHSTVFPLTATCAAVRDYALRRYSGLSTAASFVCVAKLCFTFPEEQERRSDIEVAQEEARVELRSLLERIVVCIAVVFDDVPASILRPQSETVELSAHSLAASASGNFDALAVAAVGVINRLVVDRAAVQCDLTFQPEKPSSAKHRFRVHFVPAALHMTTTTASESALSSWTPCSLAAGGVAVHCLSREAVAATQSISVQTQIAMRCTALKAQQLRPIRESTPLAAQQAASILLAALAQLWWAPRQEVSERYAGFADADAAAGDFWDADLLDEPPATGRWFASISNPAQDALPLPSIRNDLIEVCRFASAARGSPFLATSPSVAEERRLPSSSASTAHVTSPRRFRSDSFPLLQKKSDVFDLFRASPSYPSIRMWLEITVGIQVPWRGELNPMITNLSSEGDLSTIRVRSQTRSMPTKVDVSIEDLVQVLRGIASRRYPALHRNDPTVTSDAATDQQLEALLDDILARARVKVTRRPGLGR